MSVSIMNYLAVWNDSEVIVTLLLRVYVTAVMVGLKLGLPV